MMPKCQHVVINYSKSSKYSIRPTLHSSFIPQGSLSHLSTFSKVMIRLSLHHSEDRFSSSLNVAARFNAGLNDSERSPAFNEHRDICPTMASKFQSSSTRQSSRVKGPCLVRTSSVMWALPSMLRNLKVRITGFQMTSRPHLLARSEISDRT